MHDITSTARRLEAGKLDRRINLEGPPDELKELADTFDGMLDRLAESFDSQKRFVANASHELRTPLAVQRTLVGDQPATQPGVPGVQVGEQVGQGVPGSLDGLRAAGVRAQDGRNTNFDGHDGATPQIDDCRFGVTGRRRQAEHS